MTYICLYMHCIYECSSLSKDTCVISLIPQNTFLKQQLMALFSWKFLQMFKFGSPRIDFVSSSILWSLYLSWWEISICRPHWYYRRISTGIFICLMAHLNKTRAFLGSKGRFNGFREEGRKFVSFTRSRC